MLIRVVPATRISIERGKEIYAKFQCHLCHGVAGDGIGHLHELGSLKDDNGLRIAPTDFTNILLFKNGPSAQDIVRSTLTGLNGTPMPSYAEAFSNREEDVWHLANYILSLSSP